MTTASDDDAVFSPKLIYTIPKRHTPQVLLEMSEEVGHSGYEAIK